MITDLYNGVILIGSSTKIPNGSFVANLVLQVHTGDSVLEKKVLLNRCEYTTDDLACQSAIAYGKKFIDTYGA